MVRPDGASLNELFNELRRWEEVLKDTSLVPPFKPKL